MTPKQQALRAIEALPEDASIAEAIAELRHLATEAHGAEQRDDASGECAVRVIEEVEIPDDADAWEVLRRLAGSIEAPTDWATEHDHYLYGTPRRGGGE